LICIWVEFTGEALTPPVRPPPLPNLERLEIWDSMFDFDLFGPANFILDPESVPKLRHLVLACQDGTMAYTQDGTAEDSSAAEGVSSVIAQLQTLAYTPIHLAALIRSVAKGIADSTSLRNLAIQGDPALTLDPYVEIDPILEPLVLPDSLDCITFMCHTCSAIKVALGGGNTRQLLAKLFSSAGLASSRAKDIRLSVDWCQGDLDLPGMVAELEAAHNSMNNLSLFQPRRDATRQRDDRLGVDQEGLGGEADSRCDDATCCGPRQTISERIGLFDE
jgi:hypothetical protein